MEERRRGQRVMVRFRAHISYTSPQGKEISLKVNTLSVNHHGAMILSPLSIPQACHLVLENPQTGEKIGCRITRAPKESSEGYQVAVEFEKPAPNFWRIAFPPANCRPTDET